jgi:sterol desaturase/sphingolipid hydroxylase (fatty acid hydroxylase superfamily)
MSRFPCFWLLPVIGIALLAVTKQYEGNGGIWSLLWLLPLGILLWTLLEYVLHRFVFHLRARNATLRGILDTLHQNHHADPRDIRFLLVQPAYALVISAVIASGIVAITGKPFWMAGLMCGIWAGFLAYETVHYRVHLSSSETGWIRKRRRAHFHHHFSNARRCFGVTTSLWDHVFGTFRNPTSSV